MVTDVVSPGVLSSACVEGLKYLIRIIKKDPTYSFPMAFYAIMIPVFNIFSPIALYYLGMTSVNPDMTDIHKRVLAVLIGSVISVATNTLVINPSTAYAKEIKTEA